jgi:hypothetical protein
MGDHRRRAVRDDLLASGRIVNVLKIDGVDYAVAEVPERRPARLYLADDPTIAHLLRLRSAADEPQTAAGRGDGPSEASAACGSLLKSRRPPAAADHPPSESLFGPTEDASPMNGDDDE